MPRHFSFVRPTVLALGVALAHLGCSSDDIGSRSGGSLGAGGSSVSTGANATGSTATGSPATAGSTASSTGSGSGGAAGGPSGGGGASSGTGGSGGPSAGTGGNRDAGGVVDARSQADVPLPVCNYPNWVAGTPYRMGDIVMYIGKPYIALGDNPGYDPIQSPFFWGPYNGCTPPPPPPPTLCPALDRLLPNGETTFTAMFTPTFQGWVPLPAYSYASLCTAVATNGLTGFARSGVDLQDKRELAGFFANVAIETAYLTYVDESGHAAADPDFHGRGALQITGQVIYDGAGAFLGLNLTGQPQLASQPPVVWQTGVWYWLLHNNPSVGSTSHDAIAQGNFGLTIRVIKGDCVSAPDRVTQYQKNCTLLGITPGNTACP